MKPFAISAKKRLQITFMKRVPVSPNSQHGSYDLQHETISSCMNFNTFHSLKQMAYLQPVCVRVQVPCRISKFIGNLRFVKNYAAIICDLCVKLAPAS